MVIPIEQYLKKVGNHLTCKSKTKTVLLSDLKSELLEYASYEKLTFELICNKFGSPESTAKALMESIDEKEIEYVKKIRSILIITTFTILVITICIIIYLYRKSILLDPTKSTIEIYSTEPIIIEPKEERND